MIERPIDSPIPMPVGLVVKKALNSRSAFSAEIPTPQSFTVTSTWFAPSWQDRIVSSRGRSVTDCIASTLLITRLMITCWSWIRSTKTMGKADASSFPSDVIDVERPLLNVGPFCQRPDTLDYLACPIAVIDNPLDRAARRVQVGSSTVEPTQTGFRVGADACKRLVDFVGDRSGQLSQRRHARDVSEFRLRFAVA